MTTNAEPGGGALETLASGVVGALRCGSVTFVRSYNRLAVEVDGPLPDSAALVVGNHGFGAVTDLNVLALLATLDYLAADRSVTYLVHDLAWTLGIGRLLERAGARRASPDAARTALAEGHRVVVFPGGDKDAGKDWSRRNQVGFHGRSGFARVAMEAGVPVVPVVTAGAGESLMVLSDGSTLARALRLDKRLRYGVLPVSVSVPWGVSVGLVGLLPYWPLPTKLRTAVLPAMTPLAGETAEDFALRIEAAMQRRMTRLTRGRRLLVG